MMLLQRVCEAEKQAENNSSNGPLRVQGNWDRVLRVFCNVWAYVSCRGYDGILMRVRRQSQIKVATRIG
ncbi:MAG: hypothetical protein ACI4HQ_03965 [Acetatifactor sp.]